MTNIKRIQLVQKVIKLIDKKGNSQHSDFKTIKELVYFDGETKEELDKKVKEICEEKGWRHDDEAIEKDGKYMLIFYRPLQISDISQAYQMKSWYSIEGIKVNLAFVYDQLVNDLNGNKMKQLFGENYSINNIIAMPELSKLNKNWQNRCLISNENLEDIEKLSKILGKNPEKFDWYDTERQPIYLNSNYYFNLSVNEVLDYIDGYIFEKQFFKLRGTNENIEYTLIDDKISYYLNKKNTDLEIYNTVKDSVYDVEFEN